MRGKRYTEQQILDILGQVKVKWPNYRHPLQKGQAQGPGPSTDHRPTCVKSLKQALPEPVGQPA